MIRTLRCGHHLRFAAAVAVLSFTCPATPRTARSADEAAAALPVAVAADDAAVRYVGRFDTRDKAGPRCAWPASEVELKFRGTAANVRLDEGGEDRWQVVVDGKPADVLKPKKGNGVYPIVSGLPEGEHDVRLVKRTESFAGVTQFLGFQLSEGGRLLPPERPRRRIEVVGDSISCGYGNEGKSQNEHFSNETENARMAYGAIAARELGADYVCVAWSGRKMWPDNTVPEIYDRTLPQDPSSKWDFPAPAPDVVVINLATNDFGKNNPDEAKWVGAYEAFVARVRKAYPEAHIYCASGSMMNDSWPQGQKALSTLKTYLGKIVADEAARGDKKVHEIDFAPQDPANGLGADWHPSVKTHQIMAGKLVETLKKDLGW